MRPSIVQAFAAGIATGGMIAATTVFLAGTAKADVPAEVTAGYASAVCQVLDEYNSFSGIKGIALALSEDGYTYSEAGEIIVDSVLALCPRHRGLLVRFAEVYAPASSQTVA